MRLTWKRDKPLTGLMRIGAGPRGSILHDGLNKYASTAFSNGGWGHGPKGWYWVTRHSNVVPHFNSCEKLLATEAEAKAAARAYVMSHLKQQTEK